MDKDIDLISVLEYVPASQLTYDDWLKVGMALKNEGYDVAAWDKWSAADTRYKEGICQKKWDSFGTAFGSPVTAASIVMLAKEHGYVPTKKNSSKIDGRSKDAVMSWDSVIGKDTDTDSFSEYTFSDNWNPAQDLITYIETLYEDEDFVGYVTDDAYQVDGRWMPGKGVYRRKAKDLIKSLKAHPNDVGATVGDWKKECGAWIRFNALDGEGVKNENVTSFKYALVESDSMSISDQDALYRKLELPIACLVFSGGKSLHAIVKVDASSYEEYRKRVEYLYDFLGKNGVEVDKQNRNPSRLSRMPGVTRNDKEQRLIATNIGRRSWDDWMDFAEDKTDELPQIESLDEVMKNPPTLPEELIQGILRCGHKMLISGSSKAGKSFLLIELAIALAEGKEWLGFKCKKSKVLYINLEIDSASCKMRFMNIYEALKWEPSNSRNIRLWNLRGFATPLNELASKIIRRANSEGVSVIIVDPIYKIITGDENNASEMGRFCNQFDKIATETGCAVIYSHHHSKGAQGSKRAMDRASGSGVFARDPDAQLDMIQLDLTDKQKNFLADEGATAWRLEASLREFQNFKPRNFWFNYPIHELDTSGELDKAFAEGSSGANLGKSPKRKDKSSDLDTSFQALNLNNCGVELQELEKYMDVSRPTLRKYLSQREEDYFIKGSLVFEKIDVPAKS